MEEGGPRWQSLKEAFRFPVPAISNYNNPRIVAQRGRFTIGGGKKITALERARSDRNQALGLEP